MTSTGTERRSFSSFNPSSRRTASNSETAPFGSEEGAAPASPERCVSGAWRGRAVALHAIRGAEAQSQVVSSAEVRRIEHVAVDIAACHDAKLIGQNALAA
jgi:hypothetical protein